MRRDATKLLLAVLLIAVASTAQARWYQVDVVVFRHVDGGTVAGEQWPELADLPDFRNGVRLTEDGPASGEAARVGATAFQRLVRGERRLDGAARRVSSGAYELLLAEAWRQPSFGVVGAKRVYLSDLSDDRDRSAAAVVGENGIVPAIEPSIEGTVAIKVARLLHIEVDFLYRAEEAVVRLRETRRAKLREIHYFDHPLFGVLVQVSPFVVPEEPAIDGIDPALEPVDETVPAAEPVAAD